MPGTSDPYSISPRAMKDLPAPPQKERGDHIAGRYVLGQRPGKPRLNRNSTPVEDVSRSAYTATKIKVDFE